MVVPPELELEAELLLDPLPDLVVTEGPPVVALLTPPGPAVTELDIEPVSPAPSECTTLHGLPFGPVVTVVLPETPFGPVVTVLVWAWPATEPARMKVPQSNGMIRRGMFRSPRRQGGRDPPGPRPVLAPAEGQRLLWPGAFSELPGPLLSWPGALPDLPAPSDIPDEEPPVPIDEELVPLPAEEPPVPIDEDEPEPEPADEPPVPTVEELVPPPADEPPVPSVEDEPEPEPVPEPEEEPPVPTVEELVPPPAEEPPVPTVEDDWARAMAAPPMTKVVARAATRTCFSM
ncbi:MULTISPECIES: hypothetical protein [Methylobacterium]|uniref:hypothetical protein n=1 Tax=Methylobacterium TaxID=407 RepID=UPI0005E1FE41|nr:MULTISPECIES: hypothetical protein [Methylobacterium]MBN6819816.1 hypothetical protein [Methylobacterium organophilum]MDE3748913.1 hypothetical protein [Methylobacterium radiotolerans]GAN48729.1 hypothetical protein ME121_2747 [Methylobacterium sp. ME121]